MDNKGRVIIVECKVMRVIIFDQMGNVLNKFGCSKHLGFHLDSGKFSKVFISRGEDFWNDEIWTQ